MPQVVPVYSLPEDGDGALVRGYSACPAYDARLLTWYNSSEFAQKEADTAALRAQVAAAGPPGLDTSLRNWWNVYDSWNVYRTYGVGDPMPDISDDLFAQIQQVGGAGRGGPWARPGGRFRQGLRAAGQPWLPLRHAHPPCKRASPPPLNSMCSTHPTSPPHPTSPNTNPQLAYWLETAKMRSALTGSLLGGLQLGDLLAYLARAEAALASNAIEPSYYKLVHLSGHYNTQLGVLGALGTDEDPGAANVTWLTKIPSLAALMAFELHGDAAARPQELAVRLVMQVRGLAGRGDGRLLTGRWALECSEVPAR